MNVIIPHFLLALALSLMLGGPVILFLKRLKARQVISLDAPQRHQAKAGTPIMGGLIFVLAGSIVAALSAQRTPKALALVVLTLGFAAIGALDDTLIIVRGKNLGLKARQKLALQIAGAVVFVAFVPFLGPGGTDRAFADWSHNPAGALVELFHIFLIVALSNAVNLTDGLDGLASGIAVPVWLVLSIVATSMAYAGDLGVLAFCAAFAGSCLGFLWFNAHPASVFMGDTGSLGLGAGIAGAAILLKAEWVTLIAAGVYLLEMISVILQVVSFKSTGRRIFRMTPLHHHFELIGWAETKIVARFTIVAIALAFLSLSLVV